MTIVRNIVDNGTTIGSLSFPDGTSEPVIAAALAGALGAMRASANVPEIDPGASEVGGHPPMVAVTQGSLEAWYAAGMATGPAAGTAAFSANVLRLMPFLAPRRLVVDRVAVSIATQAVGNLRIGLYRTIGGGPGAGSLAPIRLVAESASIDSNVLGRREQVINDFVIPGGELAWLGLVCSASITIRVLSVNQVWPIFGSGNNLSSIQFGMSIPHSFGPLPQTLNGGLSFMSGAPAPAIYLRCSG